MLYWLETARRAGGNPSTVISTAQEAAGYAGTKGANADKIAIIWSLTKLEGYGCFDSAGMAELRKGNAPTITKGEHSGDSIAIDHVLPRAIVPEFAPRFSSLEVIPVTQPLSHPAPPKVFSEPLVLALFRNLRLSLDDLIQTLPQLPGCPLLVGKYSIQKTQCIRWVSAA